MRILFFGSDEFAAVHLDRLIDDGHDIVGLVTQPDRPKGRGLHMGYTLIKELAMCYVLPVYQPATLREESVPRRLRAFDAELFVVIAYGKFLPDDVLSIPRHGAINVHASLLPRYRGAAPINWAIMNGEATTGVTIFRINESMDAGDIIAMESCPISDEMTAVELKAALARIGAGLLSDTIRSIKDGTAAYCPQDKHFASFAPRMTRDIGIVNWTRSARNIHDQVRALQPWPGTFTFWQGRQLKLLDAVAHKTEKDVRGHPGEVVEVHKDGFLVQAGDGPVLVRQVHPESSNPMDARSFLAGHKVALGEILGS